MRPYGTFCRLVAIEVGSLVVKSKHYRQRIDKERELQREACDSDKVASAMWDEYSEKWLAFDPGGDAEVETDAYDELAKRVMALQP